MRHHAPAARIAGSRPLAQRATTRCSARVVSGLGAIGLIALVSACGSSSPGGSPVSPISPTGVPGTVTSTVADTLVPATVSLRTGTCAPGSTPTTERCTAQVSLTLTSGATCTYREGGPVLVAASADDGTSLRVVVTDPATGQYTLPSGAASSPRLSNLVVEVKGHQVDTTTITRGSLSLGSTDGTRGQLTDVIVGSTRLDIRWTCR